MLTYYSYRTPKLGPIGITDRDFIVSQEVWWDFPEPGMYTSYMKSVQDDRFPPVKNKVRATVHFMALVCKPLGEDKTEMMLVTNVDINGLVPKWVMNIGARTSPSQWFVDCERACKMFKEGKFSVKPEHITDYRYGEF